MILEHSYNPFYSYNGSLLDGDDWELYSLIFYGSPGIFIAVYADERDNFIWDVDHWCYRYKEGLNRI